MRNSTKIAIAVIAMLVLAASLMPAEAACGGNPLIRTRASAALGDASFVWNPAAFAASYYYSATYGPSPPFAFYTPPWTANMTGTFWSLGAGNPSIGPGDDAGTFTFPAYPWLYYNTTYYYAYYYGIYAGEIFAGWGASAGIDGCIQNTPQASACTCVLLEDNDGTNGYFAIASNSTLPSVWHTDLTQPGSDGSGNAAGIKLAPIPPPTILNAARKSGSNDLDITVTVPALTTAAQGVYQSGGSCACGPTGFKVMQAIVLRGAPPPTDRSASWTAMNLVGGTAQPLTGTALGSSVVVESLCGASNQDVYITTELHFDSGFATSIVGGNSTRIECGPNIAEPVRPRFRPGDVRPPATRQPRRSR